MGKLKVEAWRKIGASDTVLDWIENGVRVKFIKAPHATCLSNRVQGITNELFVDAEISRLGQEGAIKECVGWKPQCVLPITVVPKKNNKKRLVLDCRHTNEFIHVPKFSQEGIESVAQQIQEGDLVVSVDLKQGFRHVGLHVSCQTYFGMCWRNRFYVWTVLPFGAKMSPFIFNKCL